MGIVNNSWRTGCLLYSAIHAQSQPLQHRMATADLPHQTEISTIHLWPQKGWSQVEERTTQGKAKAIYIKWGNACNAIWGSLYVKPFMSSTPGDLHLWVRIWKTKSAIFCSQYEKWQPFCDYKMLLTLKGYFHKTNKIEKSLVCCMVDESILSTKPNKQGFLFRY